MSRKALSIFWRTFSFGVKMVIALIVALAAFAVFIAWEISKRPLDLEFAKDTIEAALYDTETGNFVQIEKAVLYWPDYSGPLLLGLQGGKVLSKEGKTILSVDEAALSFSQAGLFVGRLLPKTIILKKPALRMIRDENGKIDVGFDVGDEAESDADKEAIMTRILGYLARPGAENAKDSIISRLEAFEIDQARLIVEDHKLGISWFLPDFSAGLFSTNQGLKANFNVKLPDVAGKPSGLTGAIDYIWNTKKSILAADINNLDTMILSGKLPELEIFRDQNIVIDAHLDASLNENFMFESLRFGLTSPEGAILHPDLSDVPLPYQGLSVSAIYDTASKTLVVDNTNITLAGITVKAKADIKQEEGKISGPVKIEIDDVAQEQLGSVWPKALKGDNSEEWIVHKMSKGRFQSVWLGLDISAVHTPDTGWQVDTQNIMASFAFKDMDLDYRPPMHPVNKASGSGTFDLTKDEMKISITEGFLGKLAIKKSDLLFDRLVEEGVGGVTMETQLQGNLQDVMTYISEEPLHLNKEMKMDIAKVKGNADLKVNLNFPTRKDIKLSDFTIGIDGTLKDVFLPAVVRDLDLSGGPMTVGVKDGAFHLSGKGLLDQRDVELEYMEYLDSDGKDFKSKVKASLIADPNMRERLGIDLSSFIEGSLPVNVEYTSFKNGTATAQLDIDATSAVFFVDPFDFEKPSGIAAKAKMTAHFKDKQIEKITDLQASGEGFDLKNSTVSFIHKGEETLLSGGALESFTLQETKGKLDFEIDKDRVAKIVLNASFLDIRPFMDVEEAKGEYTQLPMMVSVTASQMRTADKETVRAAQMYIDIDGQGRFNQMEMDAIAGASALYVRFKKDETGKRVFRLKTEDAGAALRSFQVYSNIRGGTMVIYAEPVGGGLDRNLIGKAEITNFKAVKAPVLSKLLSILSVPGLIEVMSSDGLTFSKLEADFDWLYRKEGSLLVLKNGRTSGNSLGLTFDGTFDNAKRNVNVEGTVIPMSGVNHMIGSIPLVGDILTGGSGSIFAATYSIEGSSENPDIDVNPLSVLTPGILRRILFE